ncbi:MAG: hypothetical protein ACLS9H_04875 [Dialister sp.]
MNREENKLTVKSVTVRNISETALLSVLIAVSGAFKIPGFVPGSEFQMSAPIAVAVCGVYGAKKYIVAGLIASGLSLALGTHTFFNVLVAMTFRLVVALAWIFLGSGKIFYILSGLMGTMAARGVVSLLLGKGFYALAAAAFPGMIFTMATSCFFAKLLGHCRLRK